jgi:hypothetical protein
MGQQHVRSDVTQVPAGAFETLDVTDDAAVGFTTATIPNGCVIAECFLDLADVRYRRDGTDPTQAVGEKLFYPMSFKVYGENDIRRIRFRACNGTTHATISVSFGVEA